MTDGRIPRCSLCRTYWRPDADGWYRDSAGNVYCVDDDGCDRRRDLADELDRLAAKRLAA